MTATGGHGGRK